MSNITGHQQKIIDLAQEILKPFNTEVVSYEYCYFEDKNQNAYDSEHDCCDNEKCVKAELKSLRKEHGSFNVLPVYSSNSYEETYIRRCTQCSKPLSEYLHSIEDEFSHHKEHSKTKKDFTDQALEIIAILYGFSASDSSISNYERNNPERYKEAIESKKKEIHSMVQFAKKIIKKVFPLTDQEILDIEEIGGLYTIKGKLVQGAENIYRAKYIDTSKKEPIWKSCYLFEDYHAKTLKLAKLEKQKRKDKTAAEELSKEQYKAYLKKKYYYRDAINAGNCEGGIKNFIQNAKLSKRKGYTGELLVKLADKFNVRHYVDKMIHAKKDIDLLKRLEIEFKK